MTKPSATLRGLTEKEAGWLYDYVREHTGYCPEPPVGYPQILRRQEWRYRLTVPGMPQAELADLLRVRREGGG